MAGGQKSCKKNESTRPVVLILMRFSSKFAKNSDTVIETLFKNLNHAVNLVDSHDAIVRYVKQT